MNKFIKVNGLWNDGIVLDNYIKTSKYIGDDVFGSPQFDTTYTKLGNLLHKMKYNGHFDTSQKIADFCTNSLKFWIANKKINIIIPIPPTTERDLQPVFAIGKALSKKLNIPYSDNVLTKINKVPSKSMPKNNKQLKGSILQVKPAKRKCNILLIDDFYSTGETANECVATLKKDPLINEIYYLAIVKTK